MCLPVAVHFPERMLATGMHEGHEWAVTHNGRGNRCGYVKVLPGHPWYGKSYDDIEARCHGGLTFSEPDVHCGKGGADDGWWVGFDANHGFDLPDRELAQLTLEGQECMRMRDRIDLLIGALPRDGFGPSVRSQSYMEAECRSLCEQAARAAASV